MIMHMAIIIGIILELLTLSILSVLKTSRIDSSLIGLH